MVKKLEEICAAKVVANLCCKPKIKEKLLTLNLFAGLNATKDHEDFYRLNKDLEQQFLDGIKSLPYLIRPIMPKHLIHFMASEIMIWMKYYFYELDFLPRSYCLAILKSSHFTYKGTLDRILIAREMIQDKSLNVLLRICIAIEYFLIQDIRTLWSEMSEEEKKCVRPRNSHETRWKKYQFERILSFATENKLNDEYLLSVCLDAFRFRREDHFKSCWKWLNLSEKEIVSKKCVDFLFSHFHLASYVCYDTASFLKAPELEFLRFLMYNTNEELLKTILKECILGRYLQVLKYLLLWPYQDLFMKTLKLVLEKITLIHFYELLHLIVDMIEDDVICNTYNYRLILKEVWKVAPLDYRKNVSFMESEKIHPYYATQKLSSFEKEGVKFAHYYSIEEFSELTFILSKLFCFKTFTKDDEIFVKQIASDTNANKKLKIVSTQGDDICQNALLSGKLGLADLFMECFVEKELISEYKQGFFTRRSNYISDFLLSSGKESLNDAILKWASDL